MAITRSDSLLSDRQRLKRRISFLFAGIVQESRQGLSSLGKGIRGGGNHKRKCAGRQRLKRQITPSFAGILSGKVALISIHRKEDKKDGGSDGQCDEYILLMSPGRSVALLL